MGSWQGIVSIQAVRPCLYGLMIDNPASIHIGQRLKREPPALLFLRDPRRKGLLDDPFRFPTPSTSHLIG